MGFILDSWLDGTDASVLVQPQAEFGSVAVQQGMVRAPFAQCRGRLVKLVQVVGDLRCQGIGFLVVLVFKQLADQLIAELAAGPDNRPVETELAKAAVVIHLKVAHQGESVGVRHQ